MDYIVKVSSPDFQLPAVVLQNLIHPEAQGGSGGTAFEFIQSMPSAVWTIHHNLGRYPSGVTLIDSAKRRFEADVVFLDLNSLRVTMIGAQSGTAYLS